MRSVNSEPTRRSISVLESLQRSFSQLLFELTQHLGELRVDISGGGSGRLLRSTSCATGLEYRARICQLPSLFFQKSTR